MALLDRASPVTVTITRVRSPPSGRQDHRKTPSFAIDKPARSTSPLELLAVPRRPNSARHTDRSETDWVSAFSLHVPERGRGGYTVDNPNRNVKSRSRSYSPFNSKSRSMPCGSPTFERVMKDMLSDSDLSKDGSDGESENIESRKPRKLGRGNQNMKNSTSHKNSTSPSRNSVSPRRSSNYRSNKLR